MKFFLLQSSELEEDFELEQEGIKKKKKENKFD
jgi:hypothetical protein